MKKPGFNFSHFGMYVHDMARQERFYADVLDFTVTDRGQLPGPDGPVELVFLSRDSEEHHQIVLVGGRAETLPFNAINQISLKGDSLGALRALHGTLLEAGLPDVVAVTHGNAVSVYAPDPEGNRLELYVDLPWYVSQPVRVPIDLRLDDAALMAWLEAQARTLAGFRPREQWQSEMARRMGLS